MVSVSYQKNIKRRNRILKINKFITILLLIAFVIACTSSSNQPATATATNLEFPYQDASLLGDESHCYGIFPWNTAGTETHGGIDLAARHHDLAPGDTREVSVVAPAAGTIYFVYEMLSGLGAESLLVLLKMNDYWFLRCTFEPQSLDADTNTAQRNGLAVSLSGLDCTSGCYFNVPVNKGDWIGNLIVRNVMPGAYPHVHYALLYKSPGQTLEDALVNNLAIVRNMGTGMPPTSGPGSPITPTDLGTPSTFYCPYEYSSAAAKTIMDGMIKLSNIGPCSCVCAYNSAPPGDCGVCP
jgi:hypothetical protein